MNLVLKILDNNDKIQNLVSFDNKELFLSASAKKYQAKLFNNQLDNADKIIKILAEGATISKKDFPVLLRALRHYDEVYLCNELHEVIEELSCKALTIGDTISAPVDINKYHI